MSKIICIDPGHARFDSGAISKNGIKEKDINLSIGLKVAEYLRLNKLNVILTRDSDYVPWNSTNINEDLSERVNICNSANSDIFVSLHCNSSTNQNAKGFEIYTTRRQNNSDILATKIHTRVKSAFPNLTYREDFSDGDPDKEAGFYVIEHANCPAVLIEVLFLSNLGDEKLLNNPDFQDKMAFAIAQGICDYLGIKIEKNLFKDIPNNHWAKDSIEKVAELGILVGVDKDNFAPSKPVTRDQLAVVIDRLLNYLNK